MSWMKNSAGKPDAMLTMSFIAFLVCAFRVLVSGLVVRQFSFGITDPVLLGAILAPTLGAYVARRYTDVNATPPPPPPPDWLPTAASAKKKQG